MIRAALKFCATGLLVFALDFALLWMFQKFLLPLVAVSVAYFLAVGTHYALNKWWVFESRAPVNGPELARYLVLVAACWLCTVTVVWLALRSVTGDIFVAKALAIAPATLLGFILMRHFVFR